MRSRGSSKVTTVGLKKTRLSVRTIINCCSTLVNCSNTITDRKLESLQRWISASNWTEPYESSKSTRLDNTGFWILKDPEYQAWLAQVIPYPFPGSVFAKNILVIAGKYLCIYSSQSVLMLPPSEARVWKDNSIHSHH